MQNILAARKDPESCGAPRYTLFVGVQQCTTYTSQMVYGPQDAAVAFIGIASVNIYAGTIIVYIIVGIVIAGIANTVSPGTIFHKLPAHAATIGITKCFGNLIPSTILKTPMPPAGWRICPEEI
ncbi:hypothetical protein KM043_009562 [Ampulex compressa]|nr:hypothetical protein KM043_009562 [Ampulex compressa]